MSEFLDLIFGVDFYMPHGYCLYWQPELIWMHTISDLVIFLAYALIPCTIAYLIIKRKQTLPFRWVFVFFALFIVLCGLTHLISLIVLWHPIYYFQGVVKVLTGIVSMVTAILLFPILPEILTALETVKRDNGKG